MNKKYYYLEPAVDTDETGRVFPAVQCPPNYNFNSEQSAHRLNSIQPPEIKPDLSFNLSRGAKLCDIMGQATISTSGILISSNLKSLIDSISLPKSKFYPASIKDALGRKHQFFWLQFDLTDSIKYIDLTKSVFKFKTNKTDFIECQFDNFEDFSAKRKELSFFNPLIPVQLSLIDTTFDLYPHPLNSSIFCASDGFINVIRSNQITGVSISDLI